MIFVINNLKYDTDKMKLISDKCEYQYTGRYTGITFDAEDVRLFKSVKGNWLLVYKANYSNEIGRALTEEEAKQLLLNYDLEVYEKLFMELLKFQQRIHLIAM